MRPLLEIRDLTASYHGIPALHIPHLTVNEGELVSVIGPNGAGKTTLLRAISRLVDTRGSLLLDGKDLASMSTVEAIQHGIAHCPEGRSLFPQMTVRENLMMGAFLRTDRDQVAEDLKMVEELFPILAQRRNQRAGTLSGGEQQMCAIGRALMQRPRLLLLDEPSFGLAPIIVERVQNVIMELARRGLTILLVEQNAAVALAVSKRTYILETGRVVREDASSVLLNDAGVREAYLGMA